MHDIVKCKILFIALLILFRSSSAAFELSNRGIISTSLAGAGCGAKVFDISAGNNPAFTESGENIALSYRNIYGIKELRQTRLSYSTRIYNLPTGFSLHNFGYKEYSENCFTLTSAFPLHPYLQLGIALSAYHLALTSSASGMGLSAAVGGLILLGNRLSIGAAWDNVYAPINRDFQNHIPEIFRAGVSFSASDNLTFFADVCKENRFPFAAVAAFQYRLASNLNLRAGVSTGENLFCGGFDVAYKKIKFCYTFRSHPYLGMENFFGVIFQTKNEL